MRIEELTITEFLSVLAAKSPTPGGGAVAALAGAIAAAQAAMVVNYSIGKKSLADFDALHQDAIRRLGSLTKIMVDQVAADALAYGRLNELWKLDRADPRRVKEFQGAVLDAIEAPMSVLNSAVEMLNLLRDLAGKTNAMLASDLAIAAILADAAVRSAAWNVRINLPQVDDAGRKHALEQAVAHALSSAAAICQQVGLACRPT